MATKESQRKRKARFVVHGYVRSNSKKLFPSELADECLNFYFEIDLKYLAYEMDTKWDEFDAETVHSDMMIDDGNTLNRPRAFSSNPYCFGKHAISEGIAIWRFKVIKAQCYWIGIVNVNSAIKDSYDIQDIYSGNLPDDSYFVSLHGCPYGIEKYKAKGDALSAHFFKNGDIACMMLDLNQRTLSYSTNNGDFECMFKDIEEVKYKFAVCIQQHAVVQLMASEKIN